MKEIKIYIEYKFFQGPYGGGNQFLKALKNSLIKKGYYSNNPKKADCILFNSHHNIQEVLRLKLENQSKIFIHRLDGPIQLVRGNGHNLDPRIYILNNLIADGTIFQSKWSQKKNYLLGLKKNNFETIINNGADKDIFYRSEPGNVELNIKNKVKLIATSWSENLNKGFHLYKFLDEYLNFNQYHMKFIGNSPIRFKNIQMIKPKESKKLANLLQRSHIYITGSKNDPCSNSLIEALSCGLPCVALNDGGHPEIVKNGGELFNNFNDCLKKIQLVRDNYKTYRDNIQIQHVDQVCELYYKFIKKIYLSYSTREYKVKKLTLFNYYSTLFKCLYIRNIKIRPSIRNEMNRIKSWWKKSIRKLQRN